MITGVILANEASKQGNNLLNEFCNFNNLVVWNKSSGGSNATITSDVLGRRSYVGLGCIKIAFSGTGEVTFNSGGTQMQRIIQRDGNYLLSYAFNKTDPTSDINFIVEMYVNGTLYPANTIQQDLYNTSGFVDDQWNIYFQNVSLQYGDLIDFSFRAQSDTTGCQLYFDRMALNIDDKGDHIPSIYAEAPLTIYEEENILSVGTVPAGEAVTVTASLTGATFNGSDLHYIAMSYPKEITDQGLVIGYPAVTANNQVKFVIYNPTGSNVILTASEVYNLRLIR